MRAHKTFEEIPSNSRENVLEVVRKDLDCEEMPKLLSEFIELLGKEEEEWGGVAAMKACVNKFLMLKKAESSTAKVYTAKEFFEEFLFSHNRYVHIQGPNRPSTSTTVNQGVVVPPANLEILKGSDRPSTSKTVTKGVVDPAKNLTTSKGSDRPSTSKTVAKGVVDPAKNLTTSKRSDRPSTSKEVTKGVDGQTSVPPANPKTLKVKIYLGSGWDIDFPKLYRGSTPNLSVNVGVGSQKTKVKKNTRTFCWGEEFQFLLSNSEDANLHVEVNNKKIFKTEFAGMYRRPVSELKLKPGIHVIPLYFGEVGKPCTSARLLVRFMFV